MTPSSEQLWVIRSTFENGSNKRRRKTSAPPFAFRDQYPRVIRAVLAPGHGSKTSKCPTDGCGSFLLHGTMIDSEQTLSYWTCIVEELEAAPTSPRGLDELSAGK
jgi:hypothetical protein